MSGSSAMVRAPASVLGSSSYTSQPSTTSCLATVRPASRSVSVHFCPHASPRRSPTERPAVALKEIGVRLVWRKTGTARRIHDALLATRGDEPYVTLMVNPAAGDGKVHALYKSWGYEDTGQSRSSPVLTVVIRAIR